MNIANDTKYLSNESPSVSNLSKSIVSFAPRKVKAWKKEREKARKL